LDTKPETSGVTGDRAKRVIKRYSNRKLYDTKDSRYVTLLQIAEMVRSGEEVQIIDNNSKEDLTEVTLAQIIYEEQKTHSRNVPLQTLKDLIHARTEKVLEGLREGPIGRLIPGPKSSSDVENAAATEEKKGESVRPTLVDQAKEKFEELQHTMDERVKTALASFRPFQQMQHEVKRLTERLEDLERKLKGGPPSSGAGGAGSSGNAGNAK
jgi:polyhydroxyalkanoate synthesis repressor PhaR